MLVRGQVKISVLFSERKVMRRMILSLQKVKLVYSEIKTPIELNFRKNREITIDKREC